MMIYNEFIKSLNRKKQEAMMNAGSVGAQQSTDLVGQLAVMTLALDMVDSDVEEFGALQESTINFVREVRGTK